MRSDRTFQDEMDAIGSIPGVMYETEASYEEESGHRLHEYAGWWRTWELEDRVVPKDAYAEETLLPDDDWWAGEQRFRPIEIKPLVSGTARDRDRDFAEDLSVATRLDIERAIEEARDGSAATGLATTVADLGMDAFGCYLPWHAYARSRRTPWGMYFFLEPLIYWARELSEAAKAHGINLPMSSALMSAFWIAYRHELFHFHVERFAIRHEVLTRQPVFRPYVARVKAKVAGTEDWLEEALAQATVLQSQLLAGGIGIKGGVRKRYIELVKSEFRRFGPGYRDFECAKYHGPEIAHILLGTQVITGQIQPTFWLTGDFTPKREYSVDPAVVPGYLVYSAAFRSRFQLQMPKRRHLERYAKRQGFEDLGPGPGDHWKYRVNGHTVQVNTKRGEIDLASMKDLARALETSLYRLLLELRHV